MADAAVEVVELAERATQAAGRWQAGAAIQAVQALPGGASSLTYRAELTDADGMRPIVLKVAPAGVEPVRNRDVLRQAAILRRLEAHPAVATPHVLFEESATSLAAPPFFAMEFVAGECIEPILDDPLPVMPAPDTVSGRATSAVRMLAALHNVPIASDPFDREPPISLPDEVARWAHVFGTVEPALRPNATEVADRLLADLPAELPPVLLHGDYRLGNTLCVGPDVRAIIDWEIWSVGDPRIDLLWFLLFTDRTRLPTAPRSAPGMPTIDELIGEYSAARTDPPLADLDWFDAMIQYKQAAITAFIVKQNRRRAMPDPRLERSSLQIEPLLQRALTLLG